MILKTSGAEVFFEKIAKIGKKMTKSPEGVNRLKMASFSLFVFFTFFFDRSFVVKVNPRKVLSLVCMLSHLSLRQPHLEPWKSSKPFNDRKIFAQMPKRRSMN